MDVKELRDFIEDWVKDRDCFLVDLRVGKDNEIAVELDSMSPMDIETCVELTRAIEVRFDRDAEDYELEVGSAGLTSPLRVPAQYRKHQGHDLELLTADGRKLHGVLLRADDEGIEVETEQKVRVEGEKKPRVEKSVARFSYPEIRRAVWDLKF